MKICNKCGNLSSDIEKICQKCGNNYELEYANINNQNIQSQQLNNIPQQQNNEMRQEQTNQQMIYQAPEQNMQQQPQPNIQNVYQPPMQQVEQKKSNFFKKNFSILSVCITAILCIVIVLLTFQIFTLEKEIKVLKSSNVDSKYEINNNKNNENKEDGILNSDLDVNAPSNTYQKISQNYLFNIPKDYVSTVMEEAGGLSLLNLETGSSIWIGVNTATLDSYIANQDKLKTAYESEGKTVTKMYESTIKGKKVLLLELISNEQSTILAITESNTKESFIISINNTTNKNQYDYTALDDSITIISSAQRV